MDCFVNFHKFLVEKKISFIFLFKLFDIYNNGGGGDLIHGSSNKGERVVPLSCKALSDVSYLLCAILVMFYGVGYCGLLTFYKNVIFALRML